MSATSPAIDLSCDDIDAKMFRVIRTEATSHIYPFSVASAIVHSVFIKNLDQIHFDVSGLSLFQLWTCRLRLLILWVMMNVIRL